MYNNFCTYVVLSRIHLGHQAKLLLLGYQETGLHSMVAEFFLIKILSWMMLADITTATAISKEPLISYVETLLPSLK